MDALLRLDADDFSDEKLELAHVQHPDAPAAFRRSTLVIGSRGAGKTFLLRHRRNTAHADAVYLKLTSVLASIPRNDGIGAHADKINPRVAVQLQAKTAALIGLNFVAGLLKQRPHLELQPEVFDPLLQGELRAGDRASRTEIRRLLNAAALAPLDSWSEAPLLPSLQEFFTTINDSCGEAQTLFLDGAESASWPSVRVLYLLLDQAVPLLTVVAARPGMSQLLERQPDSALIPGDHFEILHLGTDPYGERWQSFSKAVVSSALAAFEVDHPSDEDYSWACAVARDSLRQAVQLAEQGFQTIGDLKRRAELVDLIRQDRLSRCRSIMAAWNPDFHRLLDRLRGEYWSKAASGPQPILLIEPKDFAPKLYAGTARDKVADLFTAALLCEAFFYPPRQKWSPFELPETVELNPLLVWDRERLDWLT